MRKWLGENLSRLTANDLGYFFGPASECGWASDDMTMGIACLLFNDAKHRLVIWHHEMDASESANCKAIEGSMQQEALITLSRLKALEGELPAALRVASR